MSLRRRSSRCSPGTYHPQLQRSQLTLTGTTSLDALLLYLVSHHLTLVCCILEHRVAHPFSVITPVGGVQPPLHRIVWCTSMTCVSVSSAMLVAKSMFFFSPLRPALSCKVLVTFYNVSVTFYNVSVIQDVAEYLQAVLCERSKPCRTLSKMTISL